MTSTKTTIDLANGVILDADKFTMSVMAVIAKRGRGKSGLIRRLMEELLRCGRQVVMFDPIGIMWGILSSFDGRKPSGFRVLVIGGRHGHIKLERTAGRKTAQAIVESGVSCIIDFSGQSKNVYREFVRDFADSLFEANQKPIHVILEEAPELIPQRVPKDRAQTFEAVERLASRGRNRGIGVTLVSQRTATVHKDVLTQVDTLVVGGLVSPRDRDALQEWVEDKGQQDKVDRFESGLAKLPVQHAWYWSPELFDLFRVAKTRDFSTFHPEVTHLEKHGFKIEGCKTTDVGSLIASLNEDMKRMRERSESATALQREIRDLEKRLAEAQKTSGVDPREMQKAVANERAKWASEVERLNGEVQRRDKTLARLGSIVTKLKVEADQVMEAADNVQKRRTEVPRPAPGQFDPRKPMGIKINTLPPTHQRFPRGSIPTPRQIAEKVKEKAQSGTLESLFGSDTDSPPQTSALMPAEIAVLVVVRQLEEIGYPDPPREQVALWAGYSVSGGRYQNILGRLKATGVVDYPRPGILRSTDEGKALVADSGMQLPTQDQVLETARKICDASEMKVLDVMLGAYPDALSREDLASATDYDVKGGRFQNLLGSMRTKGLIDYPAPGQVVANKLLFLEA